MNKMRRPGLLVTILFMVLSLQNARADTVHVAVASNFTETAKEIAQVFRDKTGHEAILSFGASAQLYAQIMEGAPFQVFLSADDARPRKLVEEGLGVGDGEFTYAIGKLVLWSRNAGRIIDEETLKKGDFSKIAIANPATAPYGVAAVETMKALGVYEALQPKIVQGNSIAQTFQFVNTDNAEIGFIALSQVPNRTEGSWWSVPGTYYREIHQDAVLLKSGEKNNAARAFMTFLKSSGAQALIQKFGYGTDTIASRQQ